MRNRFVTACIVLCIASRLTDGHAQSSAPLAPNTWQIVTPTYSNAPNGGRFTPQSWQVAGAYDPASQRTITFDRWTDHIRGSGGYANGVYGFDPFTRVVEVLKLSNWKTTADGGGYTTDPLPANAIDPTPVDRRPLGGGVVLDPIGNALYLVNGANLSAREYISTGHPQDTWKLDLSTRRWNKVADAAEGDLHPRIDVGNYSCMVYDPPTRTFVYFQTDYPRGTIPWILDPATGSWRKKPVSNPSIYTSLASCAYDSRRNRVLVLGGGVNIYNPAATAAGRQTLRAYSVRDNAWTELAAPPLPAYGVEFAYSPKQDVALALFGRVTYIYKAETDTWEKMPGELARGSISSRQTVTYNVAHDVFVFAGGSWDKPVWALFRYLGETTTPPPDPDPEPDPDPDPQPQPVDPALGPGAGRGCTSAYFIDVDCDGFGVGIRASGAYGGPGLGDRPDADDTDRTVNSPATLLDRYDANANGTLDAAELRTFLSQRKGIVAANIYYVSPGGNNATGMPNDPSRPYATYLYPRTGTTGYGPRLDLAPGDVVIYRGGIYDEPRIGGGSPPLAIGTSTRPIVVMSAPGEPVVLRAASWAIHTSGSQHLIVDGFAIDNPTSPGYGNGVIMSLTQNTVVRNIEVQRFNYPSAMQNLQQLLIEGYISHHNKEHGLYLGSRDLPNANVTVRGSIIYRNGIELKYGAIQHNGRVSNLRIEGNILHSNGQWGITFAQGVRNSVVQNNLIFNNQGHGIILQLYSGHGEEACANGTGTICPYEQTDNLITNNTIWLGQSSSAAILVGRNDLGTPGDGLYNMGHNTVQNNVIVTGNGPMIRALSAEWLDTWTVRRNIVFKRAGETGVVWHGATGYSLPEFDATFALADGNRFADPQLEASDLALSTTPERFDFDLRDGSPAIAFGTGTRAPAADLRGRVRATPPDAGVYVAPSR